MTIVVVMGVSGCGKTTVGAMLAGKLGCDFIEGDVLHPDANVAKMSRGESLTDSDRLPWLNIIGKEISAWREAGVGGVVSCSALKKSYRDLLRENDPDLEFLYLEGEFDLLLARVNTREGHFMPVDLLHSQLDTLENPSEELLVRTASIALKPADIVNKFY